MTDPDKKLLDSLPEELADLPFGSPEFKDANERLAQEDMDNCAEVMRAMPTWVNLTGTTVCNLKCFMCNQALDPDIPKWFMKDEVYQRAVAELYPFAKMVQFSAFGEPLMTPQLDSKLDDLARANTKLDIITNATLMKDQKTRDKLLRVLGHVIFSLDGATAETYNQVRIGADFDRVVANIEAFCASRLDLPEAERPTLGFNFILMHRTIREAPQFVRLAHAFGAQQVTFNHLVVFDDTLKDESLQFHQDLSNECLTETRRLADELKVNVTMPPLFNAADNGGVGLGVGSEPMPTPRQVDGPGMPTVKCMFLWKRVYIGVNGEVIPCCLAGVPSFGNMLDDGFQAVWNSETYQTYRRHVYTESPHGMCKNCYLIYPSPDQVEAEGFLKF
ncbi:MAG: radical SAM protein [Planctomycetota bacterium]|nr:radical SAM protein [Planctomycetota bacterium]